MSTVGQKERATQNRVVKLFSSTLKYAYLGNWEERPNNSNVEQAYLRAFLGRQGPVQEPLRRQQGGLQSAALRHQGQGRRGRGHRDRHG
jgi:type I restriction enzyme R subunit